MHSNRRCFLGLGAALGAALMLTSMHVPEAHATAGADVLDGYELSIVRYVDNVPQTVGHLKMVNGAWVAFDEVGAAYLKAMQSTEPFMPTDLAFVDGVYTAPGAEQLRLFYHDLYETRFGPDRKVSAMQPDNGAGQVSGDRAQSVGKAGDLKAGLPGKVKSETPAGKSIDATKPTSWLRRIGPWLFRQPVPS